MAEVKIAKENLVDGLTSTNNPRAGAEFLAKMPRKDVFPTFFSLLSSRRPLQEKARAVSNVREAIGDPKGSGLSGLILDHPNIFFDKLIADTTKNAKIGLSPEQKSCLDILRINFKNQIGKNRMITLSGGETSILTRDVNPKYLLSAIYSALTDRSESEEFRKTLVKTFLNWTAETNFEVGVLSGDFRPPEPPPPPSGTDETKDRKGPKKTLEEIRLENALKLVQHELMQTNITLGERTNRLLRQQGEIRELQRQLTEAKTGTASSTGKIDLDPMVPKNWYQVLDVIPMATPERIRSNFRARLKMFHPDTMLAPLEAIGLRRDSPLYITLQNLSTQWTIAIHNAFDEAKAKGLTTDNGGGK